MGLVSMNVKTDHRHEAQPGVIVIAAILRDTYQTGLSSLTLLTHHFFPGKKNFALFWLSSVYYIVVFLLELFIKRLQF